MSDITHPEAGRLCDYFLGCLPPGAALAVDTHLGLCRRCAHMVRRAETAVDWRGEPPLFARTAPDLPNLRRRLRGVLARAAVSRAGEIDPHPPQDLLRWADAGYWRSLGPRLRLTRLRGASGFGEAVWVVRAEPGAFLPLRLASEEDCAVVVAGALVSGRDARLPAGSFVEAPQPPLAADPGAGCVLLLVTTAGRAPLGDAGAHAAAARRGRTPLPGH
jgi:hypothetical protein